MELKYDRFLKHFQQLTKSLTLLTFAANSARKPFSLGLQTARILSPLSASKCQDTNTRTKTSTDIGSKKQITDAAGLSISFEKDGGHNR